MSDELPTTAKTPGPCHVRLLGIVLFAMAAGSLGMGAGLTISRYAARKCCASLAASTAVILAARRHNLSAEAARLAKKFGRWEIRPPAAMKAEIRSTLRERTDIDEIVIFDADGMELESYSVTSHPGSRSQHASMDVDDWRRKTLRGAKTPLESYRVVAGHATAFEASAPILDDEFEGYVVARASMRRMLSGLPGSRNLTVRDASCSLLPSGSGCEANRPAGSWQVLVACRTKPAWVFFVAGLLFAAAGCLLTWRKGTVERKKPRAKSSNRTESHPTTKVPGKDLSN